jgi:hypothetical protein
MSNSEDYIKEINGLTVLAKGYCADVLLEHVFSNLAETKQLYDNLRVIIRVYQSKRSQILREKTIPMMKDTLNEIHKSLERFGAPVEGHYEFFMGNSGVVQRKMHPP